MSKATGTIKSLDLDFRVSDTPYGASRDTAVRNPYIPPIVARAQEAASTEAAAAQNHRSNILVRDPVHPNTPITIDVFHRKRYEAARNAAPITHCIQLEGARVQAMDDFRSQFVTLLLEHGAIAVPPNEGFNRWVFESLTWEALHHQVQDHHQQPDALLAVARRDPLIPSVIRISPSLVRELVDDKEKQINNPAIAALDTRVFESLCMGVAAKVAQMGHAVVERLHHRLNEINNCAATAEDSKLTPLVQITGDVACISFGETTRHEILVPYAQKFRVMFEAVKKQQMQPDQEQQQEQQQEDEEVFETRLFCMLQRYRALARGPNRVNAREGSGHHSAMPDIVLDKLRELLDVEMECFASPFNSHYFPYFCSAFADVDCFFGSVGSFFDFFPVQGSLQLNPPFALVEVETTVTC